MLRVVTAYIERTRGWDPSEYRIENRGQSPDGASEIFAIIHQSDEHSPHPGAGLSVELHVNRASRQVEKEVSGQ